MAPTGSVGWGTGPKKFTEQFSYFMAYKNHVTPGFYRGGGVPDPRAFYRNQIRSRCREPWACAASSSKISSNSETRRFGT